MHRHHVLVVERFVVLVGIVEAAWRYSGVGNRRPILKVLRQVVGGVGRGCERTVGRGECETPEGVYRLGRLRIQDLGVLHLDQGKIGSPITRLDQK